MGLMDVIRRLLPSGGRSADKPPAIEFLDRRGADDGPNLGRRAADDRDDEQREADRRRTGGS